MAYISKKLRLEIWNKSKGHCWYCGCVLLEKGWHADHLVPIRRYKTFESTDNGYKEVTVCEKPHLHTIENLVPACRQCNLFKGVFSIEQFRAEISYQVERAREYSVNFRTSERFGLVEITNKPITFWFEENINQ